VVTVVSGISVEECSALKREKTAGALAVAALEFKLSKS
jgi:hypothetical protein